MSDTNRPGRDKRRHSVSTCPANLNTRSLLPPQLHGQMCVPAQDTARVLRGGAPSPALLSDASSLATPITMARRTRLACTHSPNGACTLARSAPSPDTSGAGRGPAALFEHSGWRRRSATPVHPAVRTQHRVYARGVRRRLGTAFADAQHLSAIEDPERDHMAGDDHAYIAVMYAIGDVIFMHQTARGPVPRTQARVVEGTRFG